MFSVCSQLMWAHSAPPGRWDYVQTRGQLLQPRYYAYRKDEEELRPVRAKYPCMYRQSPEPEQLYRHVSTSTPPSWVKGAYEDPPAAHIKTKPVMVSCATQTELTTDYSRQVPFLRPEEVTSRASTVMSSSKQEPELECRLPPLRLAPAHVSESTSSG